MPLAQKGLALRILLDEFAETEWDAAQPVRDNAPVNIRHIPVGMAASPNSTAKGWL